MKKRNRIIATLIVAAGIQGMITFPACAEWVKSEGFWYFQNGEKGTVKSDWIYDQDNWYYFDDQGHMVYGWLLYNHQWYYLKQDGSMAKNAEIDGFTIGEDGVAVVNADHAGRMTKNIYDYNGKLYNKTEERIPYDIIEQKIQSLREKYTQIKKEISENKYAVRNSDGFDWQYVSSGPSMKRAVIYPENGSGAAYLECYYDNNKPIYIRRVTAEQKDEMCYFEKDKLIRYIDLNSHYDDFPEGANPEMIDAVKTMYDEAMQQIDSMIENIMPN